VRNFEVIPDIFYVYTRTPLIRINWDGQPSGYAEIQLTGFFFENRLQWPFEVWLLLFTICTCV